MVKEHKLSQVQVAEKLGVTEAAVSQYLSGKRGEITLTPELEKEISKSAGLIIEGDEKTTVAELCRICSLVKDSDSMAEL